MENFLRLLPSIKHIQDSTVYQKWKNSGEISEQYLTIMAKKVVDDSRYKLMTQISDKTSLNKEVLFQQILSVFNQEIRNLLAPSFSSVINATGVILHTNLGRARLESEVVEAMSHVALNYSNLEYDLEKGERGSRYDKIESLLKLITGAEAAMVVNNNAAAVFLILRAFAKNKEVIVSRGELVEIGGSFRVSSIMAESDADLIEVGTTNKTHLSDYNYALSEKTAMVMKVHKSNFTMIGFTEEVSRPELSKLASEHQLIFYEDLGSGAIFNYRNVGIGNEPIITDILNEGVDLVSASGDKLFGGPQAGIILGKKMLIDRLKKHQLARTLRVDKITLSGLAKTLQHYLSDHHLIEIPTIRDITQTIDVIKNRAQYLKDLLSGVRSIESNPIDTTAYVGGGTMPSVTLNSYGLRIDSVEMTANELAYSLRMGTPSVVGRIEDDHLILDCRTITDDETALICNAFKNIFSDPPRS